MSLGAGALKAGGAGQQFWHREWDVHRNPASSHHSGIVTIIQSVEYLLIPSTYPWEGGEGKKSSINMVNDPKGEQASKLNAWGAPAELKKAILSHAKGEDN